VQAFDIPNVDFTDAFVVLECGDDVIYVLHMWSYVVVHAMGYDERQGWPNIEQLRRRCDLCAKGVADSGDAV